MISDSHYYARLDEKKPLLACIEIWDVCKTLVGRKVLYITVSLREEEEKRE